MTEPHVELKSVHFGYSREWGSNGRFDLDLWINGIKCMKVIEEGNGGEMECEPFTYNNPKAEQVKANIKLLENYIKALPKQSIGGIHEGGKPVMFKMDIYLYIGELLEKQKMEKIYAKGICYGKPNGSSYRTASWTGKKLAEIDKISLQRAVNSIKSKLGKGEVILNTNLQALGINL